MMPAWRSLCAPHLTVTWYLRARGVAAQVNVGRVPLTVPCGERGTGVPGKALVCTSQWRPPSRVFMTVPWRPTAQPRCGSTKQKEPCPGELVPDRS